MELNQNEQILSVSCECNSYMQLCDRHKYSNSHFKRANIKFLQRNTLEFPTKCKLIWKIHIEFCSLWWVVVGVDSGGSVWTVYINAQTPNLWNMRGDFIGPESSRISMRLGPPASRVKVPTVDRKMCNETNIFSRLP